MPGSPVAWNGACDRVPSRTGKAGGKSGKSCGFLRRSAGYLSGKIKQPESFYERQPYTVHAAHCIGDFERICDHAINLVGYAQEMAEKDLHFSAKAEDELKVFTAAVQDIMNRAVTVFKNDDLKLAKSVEPLEEVIDGLNMEIKRRHIRRLRKGKCTIELGLTLSDITTCYERVADHCSNIAVCLLQVNEDGFDTHGYLEMVRDTDNRSSAQRWQNLNTNTSCPV